MFGPLIAEIVAANSSESLRESLVETAVICCGFREPKCNRTQGCYSCLQAAERPLECWQWNCLIDARTNGGWPPGQSSCTEEPAFIIPFIIVTMIFLKIVIFLCCFTDRRRALESAWGYLLSWREFCTQVQGKRRKSEQVVDLALVNTVHNEEFEESESKVPPLNAGVTVEVISIGLNSPAEINRDLTMSGRSDFLTPNSPSECEHSLTARSLMSLQLLCRNHMDPAVLDNQDVQFISDSLSLAASCRSYDCTSTSSK